MLLKGWAKFELYLPGRVDGKEAVGKVRIRAWLTDNLRPKLLIGNDFLQPYQAVLDLGAGKMVLKAC
jgi:hypothetical protein